MAIHRANVTEGASALGFPFGDVSASKISPTFRVSVTSNHIPDRNALRLLNSYLTGAGDCSL